MKRKESIKNKFKGINLDSQKGLLIMSNFYDVQNIKEKIKPMKDPDKIRYLMGTFFLKYDGWQKMTDDVYDDCAVFFNKFRNIDEIYIKKNREQFNYDDESHLYNKTQYMILTVNHVFVYELNHLMILKERNGNKDYVISSHCDEKILRNINDVFAIFEGNCLLQ